MGSIPLLVRRGARAHQRFVRERRAGWSLTPPSCGVSDHTVCGADVASRLLFDAAASPPHEEGNAAHPNICARPETPIRDRHGPRAEKRYSAARRATSALNSFARQVTMNASRTVTMADS